MPPAQRPPAVSVDRRIDEALAWLRRHGTSKTLDAMKRYAIPSDGAFGVAMRDIQALAKQLGRSHEIAAGLWKTGQYEARMAACYVEDPAQVTAAQMDRWSRDFDNWAIVDTACFALFDRTPHAWRKVEEWSASRAEFVKRAAFALLWGLTVHDKRSGDAPFLEGLRLVEREAADDRHWVGKAVSMALRATGKRNRALRAEAVKVAKRLAASAHPSARWIGREAVRELAA